MTTDITIIDYDAGNIFNLYNSLLRLNCKVIVTDDQKKIENADRLIIPGVGAFYEGIQNLKDKNLIDPIKNFSKKTSQC